MYRGALLSLLLALGAPSVVSAQNSVFGILGVGFPGRPISVRSRALGGGFAAFDARSAANPASVTGLLRVAATATSGTTLRRYTALDSVADGLQETRFPFGLIGGPIQRSPFSFAISYSTYAERSFEVTTSDTVVLRGERIAVEDRLSSDGSVIDARGALGLRLSSKLRLGGGIHLIAGSAKVTSARQFDSRLYASLEQRNQLGFSGVGFSGGFVFTPIRRLALAGSVRSDSKLTATRDSVPAGSVDLPVSVTGGLYFIPTPAIGFSTTVVWRSWSDAAKDLTGTTEHTFDTWEIGAGIEIGGTDADASRFPLRLGARYAQLPFSPTPDRARELVLALGTAVQFANDRATLDASVERAMRDGAGANERAWHFSFGFTVRP